ncbi:hypothetical protein KJB30_12390 [Geobacter chapellei]|uniref:Uncharacterized protein n=2 Tax=Pelotalea chapellei TaxID=44671 RepID=A0ABS5UA81_9BACT|nr:hypothetical protein [Pelotalea chapellei]
MVRYQDNSCGMVEDFILEDLIWGDEITAFRRAGGWAVIGRDRLRSQGRERRKKGALINIFV